MGIISDHRAQRRDRSHRRPGCGAVVTAIKPLSRANWCAQAKNLQSRRVRRARPAPAPPGAGPRAVRRLAVGLAAGARPRSATRATKPLLTHGEVVLLALSALRSSGHTLSRDQLMDQIRNLVLLPSLHRRCPGLSRLRHSLRDDPAEPQLSHPVRLSLPVLPPRPATPEPCRPAGWRSADGCWAAWHGLQETIRYCDYPVAYPPISWSDGQPGVRGWRRAGGWLFGAWATGSGGGAG
ncbi:hypothetical protein ACPA9J_05440 [Pseudomonas aeruginosa]